nr:MAG TPA: hypothetical protein [Caudoviricetes sp.]
MRALVAMLVNFCAHWLPDCVFLAGRIGCRVV